MREQWCKEFFLQLNVNDCAFKLSAVHKWNKKFRSFIFIFFYEFPKNRKMLNIDSISGSLHNRIHKKNTYDNLIFLGLKFFPWDFSENTFKSFQTWKIKYKVFRLYTIKILKKFRERKL